MEPGSFVLAPETVMVFDGEAARPVAGLAAEQLRSATGFSLPIREAGAVNDPAVVFRISEDEALGEEGYALCVTSSTVTIAALEPAGLFYGAQTLRQLMSPEIFSAAKVSNVWKIPCVSIRDFPRFGWRGMHLDVSRHFMPKDDVLRLIDTLASLKFNRFHWHLTDDQGWRIEIKKYPQLTEVGAWRRETLMGHDRDRPCTYDGIPHGGFYTQDEIREVVQYAAARHVMVLPEIDMPGHMQAAIAACPELGVTREPVEVRREWGISPEVLRPEDSSVQFCKDVLAEVMELFPGEFIHIGGDEVDASQWENSTRVHQLCRERGLGDMRGMQHWFIQQIEVFLEESGRRLMGWDEILEPGSDGNAAIMAWRSESMGIAAARAGHSVVMAPCDRYYFDFYQARPVEQEPLAIGGFTPLKKVYEYDPNPAALTAEECVQILGVQGQLWTEYMPSMRQVEYMAFPRACALAETAWCSDSLRDYDDFIRRLPMQLTRLVNAGVNYRPVSEGKNDAGC